MPTRSWSLRSTNTAKFGLSWSQSGGTLYVTVQRWRESTATFNNFARTLEVIVTGSSPETTSSSTDQSFPSGMAVGTWVNTDVVNWAFTLPLGVSTVSVNVVWSQPASDGWINQNHTETISITPVYDAPAAPTSVAATRVSDASATLAWTTHATTDAPYTSQEVYRSENGGAAIDTAALSGSASSYTIATVANKKYTFTIQARNTAGQTDSVASSVLLTTPAALTSLTGAKVSAGIKLTFAKLTAPYTEAQILLERTADGGSTWSTVHTFDAVDLSTTTTTDWTDTGAPTSGTVQYRATVKTNGGTQGTLSAAATLSNALVLNTPPLAPTNLSPSGLVDVASPVTLAWEHTPSSDGAAQSSRQIQYSTDSGATQTDIVAGDSTTSTYDWTVSTGSFTAGQTIQWRVRTAGSQAGTYGAWSAWQTITLRSSLTVSVTDPSGTWDGGDIAVAWSATESWGSASQVAYRIVMTSDDGVAFDSGTITSTAAAGTVPAAAQRNLTDYTITVTVTDNYGLTSLPDSTTISTDFLAPATVGLDWVYDDDLGQLVFTPTFDQETSSALDDTVSWMLERSIDETTWTVVGTYDGDDPVPDPQVRVGADSWYRTTGYTSLGVAGDQTIYLVEQADVVSKWAWVAYGDDLSNQVRLGWSQTVEISSGRSSDVYEVEGQDFPASVFGDQQSERFAVVGKLLYKRSPGAGRVSDALATSTDVDLRTLAKTAGVCLFRAGDGEYWNCRITDMKVTPKMAQSGQPDQAGVSFTVERVTA
jgi:hypothetical protein